VKTWWTPLALALWILATGCGGGSGSEHPGNEQQGGGAGLRKRADLSIERGWKTDFRKHAVPLGEFQEGGPGKDGIPALVRPSFESVSHVDWLRRREPVIELELNGEARAYPLQILTWHEIANDAIGGLPVAITFCPLCNTALVFDRRVDGRTLEFGTTGKLRNSDLVMYDRQTESWWQQFGGDGVVGEYTGTHLRQLPARIVAWGEFRRAHPEGRVLSRHTGYSRPYGENPYAGYDDVSSPPFFPVSRSDKRLPPKERVVLIERDSRAIAIPYSALAKRPVTRVTLAGHRLEIHYHRGVASALDSASVADGRDVGAAEVLENGRPIPFSEPFWFAVAAFRPKVVLDG
jgi:Protein of unknown function (DUF3179)